MTNAQSISAVFFEYRVTRTPLNLNTTSHSNARTQRTDEKAFDFNYDLTKNSSFMVFLHPLCWPAMPFVCCFVNSSMFRDNIDDKIRAQHVAITRDGIKYVTDRHKTGCRMDCQDQGKVSKTVPFDKITDCDVEEPAGASGPCCCMVSSSHLQAWCCALETS